MMAGGVGASKEATLEVQELCTSVKAHAEAKAGQQFDDFTALSYATQVVAGTNYFVKVHVGSDRCIHVRIFKPLPGQGQGHELHSVQCEKTKDDPITHF